MAIRDHFRLDVLVRRAAVLQERDAELAEVERLLRMEEDGSAGNCAELRRAAQPRRRLLLAVRRGADGAARRRAPAGAAGTEATLETLLTPGRDAATSRRRGRLSARPRRGRLRRVRQRRWRSGQRYCLACGARLARAR